MIKETKEIVESIYTNPFYTSIYRNHMELLQQGLEKDLDMYAIDIIDVMDKRNSSLKMDIVVLSGLLASYVKKYLDKQKEIKK